MLIKQNHQLLLFFFIGTLLLNCQSPANKEAINEESTTEETLPKVEIPQALADGLKAIGGLDRWNEMHFLQYDITRRGKTETHLTNLKNRKILITHSDYKIGFDGKEVWVAPNKAAFSGSSARFYHNLLFYFFAIPYVLADPGINYEILPEKELDGKTYIPVKVSYNEGVGDAPDDYYIAHFDKETHKMYLLLYTVTYYQGATSEKYNALVYEEWQKVNGLQVPKIMKGYKYENGALGELRYESIFSNVSLSTTPADEAMFEMPVQAEIDSLIKHE